MEKAGSNSNLQNLYGKFMGLLQVMFMWNDSRLQRLSACNNQGAPDCLLV